MIEREANTDYLESEETEDIDDMLSEDDYGEESHGEKLSDGSGTVRYGEDNYEVLAVGETVDVLEKLDEENEEAFDYGQEDEYIDI